MLGAEVPGQGHHQEQLRQTLIVVFDENANVFLVLKIGGATGPYWPPLCDPLFFSAELYPQG